jgi:Domain of unknown function (DUF4149)
VKKQTLARLGAWLAGVWAGMMAGIGFVAAPALFTVLTRADAGRLAARLFSVDATIGLGLGALLVLIGLQLGRDRAELGTGSRFGIELALALAALVCVVLGSYALQPLMETALAGNGALSFGVLHGIASLFFAARLAIVGALAWLMAKPAV